MWYSLFRPASGSALRGFSNAENILPCESSPCTRGWTGSGPPAHSAPRVKLRQATCPKQGTWCCVGNETVRSTQWLAFRQSHDSGWSKYQELIQTSKRKLRTKEQPAVGMHGCGHDQGSKGRACSAWVLRPSDSFRTWTSSREVRKSKLPGTDSSSESRREQDL